MDNGLKVASFFPGNRSKVTPLLYKSNLPPPTGNTGVIYES